MVDAALHLGVTAFEPYVELGVKPTGDDVKRAVVETIRDRYGREVPRTWRWRCHPRTTSKERERERLTD